MRFPACSLILLLLAGCQSVYYNTMEQFGVEKRDILVDRVEEARDAQEDSKEVFQSALDQFSELVGFEGGDLEATYDLLNDRFENSRKAAERVRERIDAIESVARALFREWESEIEQYTSEDLRRRSQTALEQTRDRYSGMIRAMRAAESRMNPVLDLFRDQVLFLKHNLNARAVASLDTEAAAIGEQVRRLIREMETSIAEADAFIQEMR